MNLADWPLIGGALAVLLALIWLVRRFAGRDSKLSRHPYQKQSALFSVDERAYFGLLKEAMGGEYEIFGKISVDDIILPKKGASRDAYAAIAERRFDFVLCEKGALIPSCAILLHDNRQAEADPLVAICDNVALPLVQFIAGADYPVEAVREKLRKAMVKEPFYMVETDGRKEPRISSIDDMKF